MQKLYCNGKKDLCPHFDGKNTPLCHSFNCEFTDGSGSKYIDVPNTNYDRIRNMSIDEMAKHISASEVVMDDICIKQSNCPYMNENGDISDDCDCTDCVKKWLESEVE